MAYYHAESERRAARFFAAVRDLLAHAVTFPRAAQIIAQVGGIDVRAYPVSRCPYSVMAIAPDDQFLVIAVAYQGRRPGYWLDRLPP